MLYVFLFFSAIALIGSLIWIVYGMYKVVKSGSELTTLDHSKEAEVDVQKTDSKLVEVIKSNLEEIGANDFKPLQASQLTSVNLRMAYLWHVFSDIYTEEEFVIWLKGKNKDLDGDQPINLLVTEDGYKRIYTLLERITSGIPL